MHPVCSLLQELRPVPTSDSTPPTPQNATRTLQSILRNSSNLQWHLLTRGNTAVLQNEGTTKFHGNYQYISNTLIIFELFPPLCAFFPQPSCLTDFAVKIILLSS